MKMSKKWIALISLLLVCVMIFASCGETAEESSQADDSSQEESNTSSSTNMYQNEDGTYTLSKLGMPAYNFTESEFRVCITSNEQQSTYYSEEIGYDLYDTTDTVLNEAVKTRNDLIEQEFGVTVVACPVANVQTAVSQDITANTGLYDAAMPFMSACATLAQDGMLYDLYDYSEYIHLDAPWWDQSANESLSIGKSLYFTVGDISIMQKITSFALTFNKQMYADQLEDEYGDLYTLVREYKWTLDTMLEMGKKVTADSDGEAGMSYTDTFGLSTSNSDAVFYYLASGQKLISKDADNLPTLSFGSTESSVNTAIKVLETLELGDVWAMNNANYSGQVDNIWTLSLDVFGENRCLFRTTAFSAIKKLRNYNDASDFGIIPMPLITEDQDKYYTPSSSKYAYGICIPVNASNPEFSAYMIEALCCYAKNTITPAYYDITLKSRDAKDADSEDMLDNYIFNNVVYDLGIIYDFGSITTLFSSLLSSKSTAVVSTLETMSNQINSAIEECITAYNIND